MRTSQKLSNAFLALAALVMMAAASFAQGVGPGAPFPPTSEVSDQKAGSILIYNLYSSQAATPEAENTRINITNTNPAVTAFVHLFFVDGASCTPADVFICLTPNQTASFLASDIDPGVMGYIVASTADPVTGCPISFNFLIGSEYVKLASGHAGSLGAEALASVFPTGPVPAGLCDLASGTALIGFGLFYDRLARVLAVDNIPSPTDGNNTLIVINRIAGNLLTGARPIGSLFGLLFDDAENAYSFTFTPPGCQFKGPISSIRLLNGGLQNIIPAGRSGWMKFWSASPETATFNFPLLPANTFFSGVGRGLLGAVFNANANTATSPTAFVGGRNLHKLTLNEFDFLLIPVFPPFC